MDESTLGVLGPRELPADLASLAALFAGRLHAAGVPATPDSAGRLVRVIGAAAPKRIADLYWLARVNLLSDVSQIAKFDTIFLAVFGGMADVADERGASEDALARVRQVPSAPESSESLRAASITLGRPSADTPGTSSEEGRSEREAHAPALASVEESLSTTDFARLSPAELAALDPFLRRVALSLPARQSRRRHSHRLGDRADVRATLRRSHRSGGDPAVLLRRRRRTKPRRLVALLDISGSMEPYARAYLQVLWGAATRAKAETFVFGTRLTRLTRAMAGSTPDVALHRAGRLAPDWSGGTRIGASVKDFLDTYGRRGMARGAVVLVVSDGWERDDPTLLGRQMASLRRLAYRVVWVNPRSAAAGFSPLVSGMAAALPHVDSLVSGHTLAALDEVLDAISA